MLGLHPPLVCQGPMGAVRNGTALVVVRCGDRLVYLNDRRLATEYVTQMLGQPYVQVDAVSPSALPGPQELLDFEGEFVEAAKAAGVVSGSAQSALSELRQTLGSPLANEVRGLLRARGLAAHPVAPGKTQRVLHAVRRVLAKDTKVQEATGAIASSFAEQAGSENAYPCCDSAWQIFAANPGESSNPSRRSCAAETPRPAPTRPQPSVVGSAEPSTPLRLPKAAKTLLATPTRPRSSVTGPAEPSTPSRQPCAAETLLTNPTRSRSSVAGSAEPSTPSRQPCDAETLLATTTRPRSTVTGPAAPSTPSRQLGAAETPLATPTRPWSTIAGLSTPSQQPGAAETIHAAPTRPRSTDVGEGSGKPSTPSRPRSLLQLEAAGTSLPTPTRRRSARHAS